MIVGFQNCTVSHFSGNEDQEQNKTSGSNGGFDGKKFVHTGGCPGDAAAADSAVQISNDHQTINLITSSCDNVAAPYANIAADFDLTGYSHGVIYDKTTQQIFDLEAATGPQLSTKVICEDPNGSADPFLKVYSQASSQGYTAELDLGGASPLIYSVAVQAAGGGYYINGKLTANNPNHIALAVNTTANLTYSDGATGAQNLDVQCFDDQSLGLTLPTSANHKYKGDDDDHSNKYYVTGGK